MVSCCLAIFGGHRHYGNGDMLFVVEEQDNTCLGKPPLLLISDTYDRYALTQEI